MLKLIREWLTERARLRSQIPGWWDITVDCGFTNTWWRRLVRCHKCDACQSMSDGR